MFTPSTKREIKQFYPIRCGGPRPSVKGGGGGSKKISSARGGGGEAPPLDPPLIRSVTEGKIYKKA